MKSIKKSLSLFLALAMILGSIIPGIDLATKTLAQEGIKVTFKPNGGEFEEGPSFPTSVTISENASPKVLPEDVFEDGTTRPTKEVNGNKVSFLDWKIEGTEEVLSEDDLRTHEFKDDITLIAQWNDEATKHPPVAEKINKVVGEKVTEEEVLDAVTIPNYPEDKEEPTKKLKYDAKYLPDGSNTEKEFIAYVIVSYPDGSTTVAEVEINITEAPAEPPVEQKDIEIKFNPNGGRLELGPDFTSSLIISKNEHPQVLPESAFTDGYTRATKEVNGKEVSFLGWKIEGTDKVLTEEDLKTYEFKDDTILIAQWNEEATKYPPVAEKINKVVGEKVTEKEVLDAVTVPNYPEGEDAPTKKLKYDASNLPDGTKEEGFTAYVVVTYPDGLTTEAQVEINITKGEENPTPEKPNEPSNPSEPSKPNDSTEHTPGVPSNPSNPGNPTKPTKPAESNEESDKAKIETSRVKGRDRIETAIEISKKYFKQADKVIIVDASNFPDAMAASALAKELKAPILLTNSSNLDSRVKVEIARLGAQNVTVIGGKSSISEGTLKQLSKFDKDGVERISGKDRYETSAEVARRLVKLNGNTGQAVIASGEVFADALTVGPYAAREGYPILLVKSNSIPKAISDVIKEIGIKKVTIVGGNGSVSKSLEKSLPTVLERLSGATRYETAINIATKKFNTNKVFLANGEQWMDALVIGPVGGLLNMPILLTGENRAPQSLKNYISREKVQKLTAVGGNKMISESVFKELTK